MITQLAAEPTDDTQPGRARARWSLPTKILGYIVAVSSLISVVAITLALMSLNSSVSQQAQQSRRDAKQAAQVAAIETAKLAAIDAACQIYKFNIGEPTDPPPATKLGTVRARRAAIKYQELGCR